MASFSLRCPECRDKFPWSNTASFPRYCPLCRADINNDREDDDIVMPAFLSPKTKATDKVYSDIVKGSEYRQVAAAELAGTSVEDMSSLKITNLNTRRDAEIMAVAPVNPVSQFMQANPNAGGFQGSNGVGFSAGTSSGPFANAGAKFQSILRADHAERTNYRGVGDNPAIEVMNPNYRRRA